jgi:hypothetical protein
LRSPGIASSGGDHIQLVKLISGRDYKHGYTLLIGPAKIVVDALEARGFDYLINVNSKLERTLVITWSI